VKLEDEAVGVGVWSRLRIRCGEIWPRATWPSRRRRALPPAPGCRPPAPLAVLLVTCWTYMLPDTAVPGTYTRAHAGHADAAPLAPSSVLAAFACASRQAGPGCSSPGCREGGRCTQESMQASGAWAATVSCGVGVASAVAHHNDVRKDMRCSRGGQQEHGKQPHRAARCFTTCPLPSRRKASRAGTIQPRSCASLPLLEACGAPGIVRVQPVSLPLNSPCTPETHQGLATEHLGRRPCARRLCCLCAQLEDARNFNAPLVFEFKRHV